ncbi:MAG: hypothetical protein JNL96_17755 [Planctomycetaceae bacterium]|nr:hypothetical protein [Planctomycetaceae bacterium]
MADRRGRVLLLMFVVLVACGGAVAYYFYRGVSAVPEFYAEACAMPIEQAAQASDEFSDQAFDLANDVERLGEWSALFTDQQINGWLATDLVKKHPELLPPGFENPRIHVMDNHGRIGVRYTMAGVPTVAWIDVEAALTPDHEIALRIREIRAGNVPLPLATLMEAITNAAQTMEVPLRWASLEDSPTAIISLPQPQGDSLRYELRNLKLEPGRLFVSGRTYSPSAAESLAGQ